MILAAINRAWIFQSGDGAIHQLYQFSTQRSATVSDSAHAMDGGVYKPPIIGEPLNAHLRGAVFLKASGSSYVDAFSNDGEYISGDGSLIKGKLHLKADGTPDWWEITYPDGKRVEFRQVFNPAGHTVQEKYFTHCGGAIDLNADYPQEMVGWFPTRVESSTHVGFNLDYDGTYGYLVSRIHDDTSRRTLTSPDDADIIFTIGTTDKEAGRYTTISYPGVNGARLSVGFIYYEPLTVNLRRRDGQPFTSHTRLEFHDGQSGVTQGYGHAWRVPGIFQLLQ